MVELFKRCRPRIGRRSVLVRTLGLALGVAGFALPAPAPAADINVILDQAKLVLSLIHI